MLDLVRRPLSLSHIVVVRMPRRPSITFGFAVNECLRPAAVRRDVDGLVGDRQDRPSASRFVIFRRMKPSAESSSMFSTVTVTEFAILVTCSAVAGVLLSSSVRMSQLAVPSAQTMHLSAVGSESYRSTCSEHRSRSASHPLQQCSSRSGASDCYGDGCALAGLRRLGGEDAAESDGRHHGNEAPGKPRLTSNRRWR